jgi:ankyrin repeat protein
MSHKLIAVLTAGLLALAMGCGGKEPPPAETPADEPAGEPEVVEDEAKVEAETAEPKVDPKKQKLNEEYKQAVDDHDWILAKKKMDAGAEKNAALGVEGVAKIHIAALEGDLEAVKKLVEEGAIPTDETTGGQSPLHMAALAGSKEIVDFLIEKGAEVNAGDWTNDTAVHFAALGGHLELVKYLVEEKKGSVKVAKGEDGCSPLFEAVESGNLELVKYLQKKGASTKKPCEGGVTLMHVAASNDLLDVAKFLKTKGGRVNQRNEDGQTPLHAVARDCPEGHDCVEMAEWLIGKGAKKSYMDGLDMTPFDYAAEANNSALVGVLEL